ncbi:porin family protein [Candidatus Pelagibacter ubique]|nr:porin family protein [Candidatus Pelagibacter ubique]
MKKFVILLFTFSLLGLQSVKSQDFYIEGHVNYNQVDDVDVDNVGSFEGLTFSNMNASLDYDSDTGLGFEVGAINVSDSNLRIGLSYSEQKIDLKKASGTGTVTDGITTVDFAVSATKEELASIGLSFSNDVKSYSLNAYYDFETNETFTPYVGVGLGQVDIENANDKELSKSLYLGGRHSVNDQMYVGLKGAYTMIDGPSDKLSISYDDITIKSLSLIVGYNF